MQRAMLYKKIDERKVQCFLCSHRCIIPEGQFGLCKVRKNVGGELETLVYGKTIAANVDPIEKKPLYHFLPGSTSFSVATPGCNFRCRFCQNWQISQQDIGDREFRGTVLSPEEIVKRAQGYRCRSISYTYTEPTIFFEYAYDTARLAKEKGLFNIFVTNGYMTETAIEKISPYLDAANIDLKSFRDEFYKDVCSASLKPVLENIRLMRRYGIWIEVTTLIVPGQNDSKEELENIAGFISEIGKDIPWHISRFHPDYQYFDFHSTPLSKLEEAIEIGKKTGLQYVYLGNVGAETNTVCPNCGRTLIKRTYFSVDKKDLKDGKCPYCFKKIEGVVYGDDA